MKKRFTPTITAAVCLTATLATHAAFGAFNASAVLGSAADYVVLGIGNPTSATPRSTFQVYQSGTVITGNMGVGPQTDWTHNLDATYNGRIDRDPTSGPVPMPIPGTITGGIHDMNMTGVVNDAIAASAFYASLTPTPGLTFQGLANIPNGTLVGNGGLNVINITGNIAFKDTLTLVGGPNDVFVFQYTSTLKDPLVLSGAHIVLNGVSTDNVIWNVAGQGDGKVQITSQAVVFGTFLAPFRSIIVDQGSLSLAESSPAVQERT
jgi:hypothetical protein